ncbi:MAG: MBL fold metallo-hydrolase [Collinsella sp.]
MSFGLDGVVVTHWDKDHWGGLPDVLEGVRVDRLYVADGAADHIPAELSDGPAVSELREGDAVRVGSFACELIWPDTGVRGDENADSAVLDVSCEGATRGPSRFVDGDDRAG